MSGSHWFASRKVGGNPVRSVSLAGAAWVSACAPPR